ncbi:MAG TPA: cyanophycinase [Acidobacteriota bacterium]|nr:cyanophycinase [Acidobacteriota bacterium]
MTRSAASVLAALAAAVPLCILPPAARAAVPAAPAAPALVVGAGALVIAGGALKDENAAVWRRILDLRLPGRPICIVPLASSEPRESAADVAATFARYGRGPAASATLDLTVERAANADDPATAKTILGCGGFYFVGGDQSRIADVLRPRGGSTLAFRAMLDVLARGGVVAGSSAGAAMMSDPMIGGGDSDEALRFGVTDAESGKGVWVRGGMGFLAAGVTDQHFLARGRLGRTLAVLERRSDLPLAFGVDENTALVVKADAVEAVGASLVVVVDMRGARRAAGRPGFAGARLFLLGDGDRFLPQSGTLVPAPDKKPLRAVAGPLPALPKPWAEGALAAFLGEFAARDAASATIPAERFALRLAKTPDSRAFARAGRGRWSEPEGLALGPLALDLEPVPAAPAAK